MSSVEMSLKAGDFIGPYKIERLLGKGGMGEVYLAYEESIQREVALKVIKADVQNDKETVTRFLNEGRALSLINHPNVVTVFSVSQFESYYYIAMEYIDGRALSDICTNFALPAREAVHMFLQMVDGLAALHAKNIVHRDLKPQNLIFRRDNQIKILDLGIAKVYGDETLNATKTGMIIGTVRYLAPEIAYGKAATSASDIWSLGAIFYEMLTGGMLIKAENQMEALGSLFKLNVQFSEDVQSWCEPEMQAIVKKMCAVRIEDRYNNTLQLKEDLIAFANKYPSKGLWHYQHVGRKIKNSEIVKQHLRQKGFTIGKVKRIMIDALHESQLINLKAINPDTTQKINADADETISNLAISKAIERLNIEQKYVASKGRNRILMIGGLATLAIAAIGFGAVKWIQTPAEAPAPLPVIEEFANHKAAPPEVPVVPAPVESKPVEVVPPPVQEPVAQIQEPAKVETPIETKPATVVEEKPKAKPQVPAPQDNFAFQTPKILPLPKKLILKFPSGRVPANVAALAENPPVFSWQPLTGAKGYLIEVGKDADFSKVIWSQNVEKPMIEWKQVKPGDYFWRIRASNARGKNSNFSEASELSVRVPAAVLPKNIEVKIDSKEASATAKKVIELKWSPVPFAKKYRLTVTDTKTNDVVFKDIFEEAQYKVNLSPGSYTAVVSALDASGNSISADSLPAQLHILMIQTIEAPALISPPDAATLVMNTGNPVPTVFFWNKTEKAKGYKIEIASDAQFTKILVTHASSDNRFIFKQKLKPGTYFWRVQATTEKTASSWSPARQLIAESK